MSLPSSFVSPFHNFLRREASSPSPRLFRLLRYNFYFPFCLPTDAPWNSHPVTRPRTFPTGEGDDALPPSDKIDETSYNGGAGQVDQLDESCQMFYLPDPTIIFVGLGELSFRFLSRVETKTDRPLLDSPLFLKAYMVVPFRLGETQARLATRAWTELRRIPAGLPPLAQSFTLEGNRHCVGYPAEVSPGFTLLTRIPSF